MTYPLFLLMLGTAMGLNFAPDFLSLVQTRWLMDKCQTGRDILPILLIDLVLTAAIFLTWYFFLTFWTEGWILQDMWKVVYWLALFTPPIEGETSFPVHSVLFYTTFLTSIWLWLHFLSVALASILIRVNDGVGFLLTLTDVEQKPLKSIGFASIIVTTLLFLIGLPLFVVPGSIAIAVSLVGFVGISLWLIRPNKVVIGLVVLLGIASYIFLDPLLERDTSAIEDFELGMSLVELEALLSSRGIDLELDQEGSTNVGDGMFPTHIMVGDGKVTSVCTGDPSYSVAGVGRGDRIDEVYRKLGPGVSGDPQNASQRHIMVNYPEHQASFEAINGRVAVVCQTDDILHLLEPR